MRAIPDNIAAALNKTIQTKAENADPEVYLWLSRKVTPLTENEFLEVSTVNELTTVTDVSIAISHRKFGRGSDSIFIGFVSGGVGYVKSSPCYENMKRHTWVDSGFIAAASDIAVAFDGTMPKDTQSKYEFITASGPWVFWVDSGAVYGKKLSDSAIITLAESNATKVTAARAMWSDVPGFDFGLVVFMILNGSICYRQYIDGVWSDAAPINFGPTATWVDISAQRTWDYRVALQAKDSTGLIYEMFTQFEGIGSKNAEHLSIKAIKASGGLVGVTYTDLPTEKEHIEITGISAGAPYGGLYSLGIPKLIQAENVGVEAINPETQQHYTDYGKQIRAKFDIHLNPSEVLAQSGAFSLVDSNGVHFLVGSASLDTDGLTVILNFGSFNNAVGTVTVAYTAGTVTGMAGTAIANTSTVFNPVGLVPTIPPRVETIENI